MFSNPQVIHSQAAPLPVTLGASNTHLQSTSEPRFQSPPTPLLTDPLTQPTHRNNASPTTTPLAQQHLPNRLPLRPPPLHPPPPTRHRPHPDRQLRPPPPGPRARRRPVHLGDHHRRTPAVVRTHGCVAE